MTTPSERIRRLVASGAVAPEEGDRLLAAMGESSLPTKKTTSSPSTSIIATLLNPFDRFGGGVAAGMGLVISAMSLGVSRLGVRFDGFFDLHVGAVPSIATSIGEQGVAWILPALCFFAYARIFSRHVRVIDFVGMVGLARLPLLLSAPPILLIAPSIPHDPSRLSSLQGPLLALVGVVLLVIALHITLLYQGFKNASGLAGPKLVIGFIVLLIVSELVSKLALLAIP